MFNHSVQNLVKKSSLIKTQKKMEKRAIRAENEAGFFIFQKRFEAYLISLTKRYFPSAISSIQIPSSNPSKCCQ